MEKLQVMTANRLRDGEVVYLTKDGVWSEHLAEATVVSGADDIAALEAIAARDVAARLVIAQYLFEVRKEKGSIEAVSTRERIRAAGPTIREDLGKQARA